VSYGGVNGLKKAGIAGFFQWSFITPSSFILFRMDSSDAYVP
jgi:hypothetical protein